ncbi:MAG: DUF2975 domain-containing protein [Tissierellia bacterium]|nr:DUF2975 domain-containing protein [Tissierellia bacterium]
MRQESVLKAVLVFLAICITVLAVAVVPNSAANMVEEFPAFAHLRMPGLVLVYLSLVPFYLDIWEAWKLLDMILSGEVFTEEAVRSLRRIRRYAMCISCIYAFALLSLLLLRVPYSTAYITIALVILAALSGAVLASILRRLLVLAIDYKSENDLTI